MHGCHRGSMSGVETKFSFRVTFLCRDFMGVTKLSLLCVVDATKPDKGDWGELVDVPRDSAHVIGAKLKWPIHAQFY